MYPLEATGSVRMTRNHSAVSRGLQQFLGRKLRVRAEEPVRGALRALSDRNRRAGPQSGVAVGAQGADRPHGLAEGRAQVADSRQRGLHQHGAAADAQRRRAAARPRQSQRRSTRSPARTTSTRIAPPGPPASTWTPTCARSTTPPTATTSRSTRSIRAACPGSSSTSTRASASRPTRKYLTSTMDTLRDAGREHRRPRDRQPQRHRRRHEADHARLERLLPDRLQLGAGADRRQVPRDQGAGEAARRAGPRAARATGRSTARRSRARPRRPKPAVPKPVEAAIADAVVRPSRASVVRSWIGMSRGENGKTRVTFVWEPLPKAPGDRPREEPARVSLMAIAPDGSPSFRGKVPDVALASTSPAAAAGGAGASRRRPRPSRVTFDVPPGQDPAAHLGRGRRRRRCSTARRARSPCPI